MIALFGRRAFGRSVGIVVALVAIAWRPSGAEEPPTALADGVPSEAIAGLGEAMLDDTCLRWSRLNRPDGGAELTAYVV